MVKIMKIKSVNIYLLAYILIASLSVKASEPSEIYSFNKMPHDLFLKIVTNQANPASCYKNGLANLFPAMPLLLTCKQYHDQKIRESIVKQLKETFQKGKLISLLPPFMQQKVYLCKIVPKQNHANFLIDFCFDTIQKSNFIQFQKLFSSKYSLLEGKNIINSFTQEEIGSVNPENVKIGQSTIVYYNHMDISYKHSKHFKRTIINTYLETIKDHLNDTVYYSLNDNNKAIIVTGRFIEAVLKIFINDHNKFARFECAKEYWSTFKVVIDSLISNPHANLELLTKSNQSIAQELHEKKEYIHFSKISKEKINLILHKTDMHQELKDEKENSLVINSFINALLYMNQKEKIHILL
jgi:hypothetical protein